LLLTMVRTLPALPVIDDGDQPFQPIWMDDVAAALATVLERPDLAGRTLDIAGPEVTTTNDVVDRLQRITGKERIRIPVPNWLASAGSRLASAFGVDAPVGADQVTMLIEENVIQPNGVNALTEILDVEPTPLADGLAKLADAQPEKLPSEGVGRLFRRRYWADIVGSSRTPDELFALLRRHFGSLTPDTMDVGAEPGSPTSIEEGATITMALPLRGNVQVRAEQITDRTMTLVTLEGHPLAGAIRFLFEERGDAIRVEVQSYDRAGSTIDRVAMSTIGRFLKSATWEALVERMVEVSGGRAPDGVQVESEALDEEQASRVEEWVEELVMERKREEDGERQTRP
jgi:NADH dehydrogenase